MNLPESVRSALAEMGPRWQTDIRTFIPKTFALFLPLLQAAPKDGVRVTVDEPYGPHPLQRLDIFEPSVRRSSAPVVVFVHGGALTAGDKRVNAEMYSNVLYYFARKGLVGVNANYRLAPDHPYPAGADDIGRVVSWVHAHAARIGADPTRVFLVGHSSGGTHAATWAYDPAIHGPEGPRVAGIILLSARLKADNRSDDPNARGVEAYFGADPSLYPERSPLTYGPASSLPTFIVVAEYDNPFLDVYGAELFSRMSAARGTCPRFTRVRHHTHTSMVASFNTADESLGLEIVDFIATTPAEQRPFTPHPSSGSRG